eukprot:gnl/TRDRNA2_/TRDRNA2_152746_c0_seq1.p1 gnl/TRDRNA2_/TRDRNA2_152746_c0~~gnl/TRDRNA2_/TRDRNA2_152746_c0_seq1.p1  ORF type:complete len:223 (+),score=19.98 gnl/TRDRNA2_/TRDRNA2_152746_c0_seq1:74-670(+)
MFLPDDEFPDKPGKKPMSGYNRYQKRVVEVFMLMAAAPPVDFHWFLYIDDDTFVIPQGLQNLIVGRDPAQPYVVGHAACLGLCGGAGILLSRGAADSWAEKLPQLRKMIPRAMSNRRFGAYVDITLASMFRAVLHVKITDAHPNMSSNKPARDEALSKLQSAASYHYICCDATIYSFAKCFLDNDSDSCHSWTKSPLV